MNVIAELIFIVILNCWFDGETAQEIADEFKVKGQEICFVDSQGFYDIYKSTEDW